MWRHLRLGRVWNKGWSYVNWESKLWNISNDSSSFFPLILKFGGGGDSLAKFWEPAKFFDSSARRQISLVEILVDPNDFFIRDTSKRLAGIFSSLIWQLTSFRLTADLISAEWPDLTGSFWPAKILTFWWELPIENWLMLGSSSTSGWNYRMGSFQGLESWIFWVHFSTAAIHVKLG